MTKVKKHPKVIELGIMTLSQYRTLHQWVRRNLGNPESCKNCGQSERRYEWSNISGNYLKDLNDWEPLCASCHRRKDVVGSLNYCKRGHERTAANTYIYPNGKSMECRICRKLEHDRSNEISYRKFRAKTPELNIKRS